MTELRRILLVDDEADIRTVGELALSTVGGWEVVAAGSGDEAIAAVGRGDLDLVLLDVMMPRMDGPTTLGKIRETELGRALPVIFMTAKVQPSEVATYLELGAIGVIRKPFDPMALADQIREIVASH